MTSTAPTASRPFFNRLVSPSRAAELLTVKRGDMIAAIDEGTIRAVLVERAGGSWTYAIPLLELERWRRTRLLDHANRGGRASRIRRLERAGRTIASEAASPASALASAAGYSVPPEIGRGSSTSRET